MNPWQWLFEQWGKLNTRDQVAAAIIATVGAIIVALISLVGIFIGKIDLSYLFKPKSRRKTKIISLKEVGIEYGVEYTPGQADLVNHSYVGPPRCMVHKDFLRQGQYNAWVCYACHKSISDQQNEALRTLAKQKFVQRMSRWRWVGLL